MSYAEQYRDAIAVRLNLKPREANPAMYVGRVTEDLFTKVADDAHLTHLSQRVNGLIRSVRVEHHTLHLFHNPARNIAVLQLTPRKTA